MKENNRIGSLGNNRKHHWGFNEKVKTQYKQEISGVRETDAEEVVW